MPESGGPESGGPDSGGPDSGAPDPAGPAGIVARFGLDRGQFSLDVDLALPGVGVTTLFGPSGSGKTTILRCIAGLERAGGGFLSFKGEVWQDDGRRIFIPPHRRPVGVVFQEASLFPHLSVMGNLNYGMSRAGLTREQAGMDDVLALLGIENLVERDSRLLSGGERQRVAIARALLRRPRLLLMDEPLAALDVKRKTEILPYLERLHDELDIPILYVSHAPEEVARLADHLVLMENGRAVAQGPIEDIAGRIDLAAGLAEDLGSLLSVVVGAHEDEDTTRLDFASGSLLVARQSRPVGKRLRCRIYASDVSLSLSHHTDTSITNIYPATVGTISQTPTPGQVLVETWLKGGERLVARVTRRSCVQLGLRSGSAVWVQVKAVALFRE